MHTLLWNRLMKLTRSLEMPLHLKPTLLSPSLCAYWAILFTQLQYTQIQYCAICISENGHICKCLHELCHDTLNESCQVWMSHIIYLRWRRRRHELSHGTHLGASCPRMNESCNAYDLTQALSRIKSWHTFEWVMSHIWMSRVTHISLTTQAPSRTKSAAAFSASTTPMHRCVWVWESLCLSVCLSVYLSVYLSVCLSVCLSIYLSVWLSICLSIYLSVGYLFV